MGAENTLWYGDNLEVLRQMDGESVDLIYLDPPFKSDATYNMLFKTPDGKGSPAQMQAFDDTWKWGPVSEQTLHELMGSEVSDVMDGLVKILGRNGMTAYLVMMAARLVELRRVLKSTGSIYLHCDPTASHYVKVVMDAVFGVKNFRNEIVWCYSRMASKGQRQLSRAHDVILWYSASDNWTFNVDDIRLPYAEKSKSRAGYKKTNLGGGAPSSGICELNEKGKFPEDWITHIPFLRGNERLGYPTQKPLALLERIIKASSNEGDVVLDPFCGCGTAIEAAQKLNRQWIGIDMTHIAVGLIEQRMKDAFGIKVDVSGSPESLEGARDLAARDKNQFEQWAVMRIPHMRSKEKPGGDRGIDGMGWFRTPDGYGKVVASVKGGQNVNPGMVRDLVGTVESEGADLGVFIMLAEPTKGMKETAAVGMYQLGEFESYPKVQIWTISDYFAGRQPKLPPLVGMAKAPKQKVLAGRQARLA